MVATYGFNFYIARGFGASAVGAFALATTVVMILGMLSRVGLDRAIVRFVAASVSQNCHEEARQYYSMGLLVVGVTGVILAAAMYLGSGWIAGVVFAKPQLENVFRIAAPAILFFSLNTYNAEALRGLKRIALFSTYRHVAIYLVAVLLVVLYAMPGDPSAAPVKAFSYACAIAAIGSGIAVWRCMRPVFIGCGQHFRSMLIVSLPMLLSNSLGMIISWTDVAMLGRFATDSDVGIYSIAMKMAFLTSIALNAVNSISTPKFAEIHAKGQPGDLELVMRQTTRLLFWSSIPILAILIVFGRPLLGLFGHEFEAGYLALAVLVFGQFVSTISGPVGNLLQMTGMERPFLRIVGAASVLNIVLNVALIPRWGIEGAAVASAVTLSLNNLACVVLIRSKLGFVSIYLPFGNLSRVKT